MPEIKLAKKAAKKVAKKAAKKVAKKAAKKSAKGAADGARRAYEHLHRLQILHKQLSSETRAQLDVLSGLAQTAFVQEQPKSAADLLRAGEHLAFGSLARSAEDRDVSEALQQQMQDEYDHLVARANEHWEEQQPSAGRELKAIYKFMLAEAKTAWKARAYHRSLEFARGSAALAQVKGGDLRLGSGAGPIARTKA
jgi:hypothetical protein